MPDQNNPNDPNNPANRNDPADNNNNPPANRNDQADDQNVPPANRNDPANVNNAELQRVIGNIPANVKVKLGLDFDHPETLTRENVEAACQRAINEAKRVRDEKRNQANNFLGQVNNPNFRQDQRNVARARADAFNTEANTAANEIAALEGAHRQLMDALPNPAAPNQPAPNQPAPNQPAPNQPAPNQLVPNQPPANQPDREALLEKHEKHIKEIREELEKRHVTEDSLRDKIKEAWNDGIYKMQASSLQDFWWLIFGQKKIDPRFQKIVDEYSKMYEEYAAETKEREKDLQALEAQTDEEIIADELNPPNPDNRVQPLNPNANNGGVEFREPQNPDAPGGVEFREPQNPDVQGGVEFREPQNPDAEGGVELRVPPNPGDGAPENNNVNQQPFVLELNPNMLDADLQHRNRMAKNQPAQQNAQPGVNSPNRDQPGFHVVVGHDDMLRASANTQRIAPRVVGGRPNSAADEAEIPQVRRGPNNP